MKPPRPGHAKEKRAPLPADDCQERKLPKIKKNDFGPSIHRPAITAQQPEDTVAKQSPSLETKSSSATAEDDEDYMITEKDIRFYWHEFANLLPVEETAMAQRMKFILQFLGERGHFRRPLVFPNPFYEGFPVICIPLKRT